MSDPEISSTDYSEDKLANRLENSDAPAWFETPRWGGAVPPITPRRQRAIADKRAFENFRRTTPLRKLMSGEEFILRSAPSGDLGGRVDWRDLATAMTVAVACDVGRHGRRLLVLFAAAMRVGNLGIAATHVEISKALGLSERHARRVIARLVELELVLPPVPLFVRYGAVSSQRGNAYRVSPAVYGAVDAARIRERHGGGGWPLAAHRNGQPSRSQTPEYLRFSGIEREAFNRMPGHFERTSETVEPEVFLATVPDAAPGELEPGTRGESTSEPPEAPDRAGLDDLAAARALFAELTGGAL